MLLSHLAIPSRRHSIIQLLLVDVGHMLVHEGEGQGEEEAENDEGDGVGGGDESAKQGVAEGNDGRADNGDHLVQVEDHLHVWILDIYRMEIMFW